MDDSQPVNIGVVGAGMMGARHARAYSAMEDVRFAGVYDPDIDRASDLAGRYGGSLFHSLEDLLESVDAVSIASIASSHADVAVSAMDRNVHVMIEKPLATSLCQARTIAEHARRHRSLIVMVGHIERFNPTLSTLKMVLGERKIRSITSRRTTMPEQRTLDTDVVHDLMIHDIDLVLDLIGDEINSVDAEGSIIYSGFVDAAAVQFDMDTGVRTSLIASRSAQREVRELIITVEDGVIVADLLRKVVRLYSSAGSAHHTRIWNAALDDPLGCELRHFVNCLKAGSKPLVDIECGYRAMIYADAITNLIRRGLARQAALSAAQRDSEAGFEMESMAQVAPTFMP